MENTRIPARSNFIRKSLAVAIAATLMTTSLSGIAGPSSSTDNRSVDRTTNYDENRQNRKSVWEAQRYDSAPNSVTGIADPQVAPSIAVDRNNSVAGQTVYQRMEANKDNNGLGEFLERVDRYENEEIPEWDGRISALEGMEYWEATSPIISDWQTVGVLQETPWEPEISGQTSDFTQKKWVRLDQRKYVINQEVNLDTGEVRESGRSAEQSRTDDQERTRLVRVSPTPAGVGSGWSPERLVASGINCGTWSPHPSTVPKGQSFNQTRWCENEYESEAYYLVDNEVVDAASKTRTESYEELLSGQTGTYDPGPTYPKYTACDDIPGAQQYRSVIAVDPVASQAMGDPAVWHFMYPMGHFRKSAYTDSFGPTYDSPVSESALTPAINSNPENLFIGERFGSVGGVGKTYITCSKN